MIFRGKLCDSLILLSDPPSLQYLSLPSISSPLSDFFLPYLQLSFLFVPFPPYLSYSFPRNLSLPYLSLLFSTIFFSSISLYLSLSFPFHSLHSPFSAFPYTFSFSAFSLPSISLLFQTTFPFPVSQIKKK